MYTLTFHNHLLQVILHIYNCRIFYYSLIIINNTIFKTNTILYISILSY